MAKEKIDGVVEAVHYTPEGQVDWVRVYERRGPTFSDRVLLDRSSLIKRLKDRKRFVIGQRKTLWASTFETTSALQLVRKSGREIIVSGESTADRDSLPDAGLI
jgi:hypothetical protein